MTKQKMAIVVLSDPRSGSEEALGRLFNALACAHESKDRGDEVSIQFQGAGTRWPSVVEQPGHPAHGLYMAVKDKVAGVSAACAAAFGARAEAEASHVNLIADHAVPGTEGLASIRRLVSNGYTVLTF